MNNNIKAILLTLSASFFAVLMEALIRAAQYDSNVFTIGFLRFFFGLLIIFPYLVKNKFHEELISKELKSLNSNYSLNESLVKRFIEKKIKLSKYKNGELTNSQIFDKIIKSLVQNGFDYEFSKSILNRYLSKC